MWWWSKIALLQREMYRLSEYHLIYTCEVSLLWSFGVRVCPTISEKPLYIYMHQFTYTHTVHAFKHTHTSLWKGKPPICSKVSAAFWKQLESPETSDLHVSWGNVLLTLIFPDAVPWYVGFLTSSMAGKGEHGDERSEWWNLWCNYIFLPIGSYRECSLSSSIWRVVRMQRYHDSLWDVVISLSVHRCLQLWSMAILETPNKNDFFCSFRWYQCFNFALLRLGKRIAGV